MANSPAAGFGPLVVNRAQPNWAFNSANPAVHLDPQAPNLLAAEHPSRGAGLRPDLDDQPLAPAGPAVESGLVSPAAGAALSALVQENSKNLLPLAGHPAVNCAALA